MLFDVLGQWFTRIDSLELRGGIFWFSLFFIPGCIQGWIFNKSLLWFFISFPLFIVFYQSVFILCIFMIGFCIFARKRVMTMLFG
jgi:hypothetical protein